MKLIDLSPEIVDRLAHVRLDEDGNVTALEFTPHGPVLDGLGLEAEFNRLVADGVRRATMNVFPDVQLVGPIAMERSTNMDVVTRIAAIVADHDVHQIPAETKRALIDLFNDHVDEHSRRVRCDAVIVAPDGVKGEGDGPVVGYVLSGRMFGLDGRPFPNSPVAYDVIKVDDA